MFGELMEQLRDVGKDIAQDVRTEQQRLQAELRQAVADAKPGPRTQTITVAKPYCSPARNITTGALQPYGVKVHAIDERTEKAELRGFLRRMKVEARTWDNLKFGPGAVIWLPMAIVAEVRVNEAAAAWAEYLLLRTGKLYVPGKYVNPRNAEWAARHGGQMPPAWAEGRPWIETSCSEGMKAWAPLREAAKKGRSLLHDRGGCVNE